MGTGLAATFAKRRPYADFRELTLSSRRYPYVFFATAKTGHTTIKRILLHAEYFDVPGFRIKQVNRKYAQAHLPTPDDLGASLFLQKVKDPKVVRFAVVRDPFARTLSCFLDRLCGAHSHSRVLYRTATGHAPKPTAPHLLRWLRHVQTQKPRAMDSHWRPQACDLPPAANLTEVIRFEQFQPEVARVLRQFLPPERIAIAGRVLRKGKRPTRTDAETRMALYTPEARAIVRKVYAEDFARFDYPLDP